VQIELSKDGKRLGVVVLDDDGMLTVGIPDAREKESVQRIVDETGPIKITARGDPPIEDWTLQRRPWFERLKSRLQAAGYEVVESTD
jgi:hypothetical protein